jgi:hypothetical protein
MDEMTEPELGDLMASCARKVQATLPPLTGFVILAFEFSSPGISQYVANGQRADIVKALREAADRLERRQDVPR